MSRRLLIAIVVGGISLFGLVRSLQHARRPAYESHITGDAAARAGIELSRIGKHEKAIKVLEQASGKPMLEVPLADLFAALGESYQAAGPDAAGKSRKPMGLVYSGLALKLKGETDKAEAAFKSALELDPGYSKGLESLGALYLQTGRQEAAIPLLEHAIDADGSVAITHSNLALAYAAVGRFDSAQLQIDAAARLGYDKVEKVRQAIERARAGAGN